MLYTSKLLVSVCGHVMNSVRFHFYLYSAGSQQQLSQSAYHTATSEIIFNTFLVTRMCELRPDCGYNGLRCHLRVRKHVRG